MEYTEKINSPIGDIWITVDQENLLGLTIKNPEKTNELSAPPELFFEVKKQLEEYFSGNRQIFDLPIKFTSVTPFQKRVLDTMCTIPFGSTITYSELATKAGNPKAIRAAASVCPKNPVSIVVPCHRVVRKDGTTGEYAFGSAVKKWLLRHETKYKEKNNGR